MPAIDLSILNQRQTPAFYADIFANRPAAGFIGRIFVSTNTFEFYRDNGTTWDLIGGPGTSTVTGTGANGQVTYWNGASSITGSNNLFFDAVNGHLGIGTITPGTALEIDHDQNTIIQLQQTVATNDNRITFINSGVGLWRLGAFYNAGANDFGLFDIAAAAQPVTVKRTTGQVLIGTSTVGSGKLVVASSTGDNGVQIVGATAPSLRIDNAESGPTKRIGLGISTATNNFIQGSADRDFCMFNGSTTASPILFGIYDTTNVQEASRISAARNLLVGGTTDVGHKLMVYGRIGFNTNGQTYTISSYVGPNSDGFNIFIGGGGENSVGQVGNTVLGSRNVSLGETAFFSNTEGFGNIAMGRDSLYNNTTGNQNVALGFASFLSNTTGSQNTSVGASSGRFTNTGGLNQTSENGTFIGHNTRGENGINEIVIGYNAQSGGSNTATLGNTSIIRTYLNGNTLIGTTTDTGQKLQVNGTSFFNDNVGIGSSTSPWGNNWKALEFLNGVYITALSNSTVPILIIGTNAYFDNTNFIYKNSGQPASRYQQDSGTHYWYNAPSGTAGNNITFTQAMTLTSNGNLLIGTTSNGGSKLRIVGLPTSAAGLSSGDIYSNLGVLTIVP
jgi:hypothetical protein